LFKNFLGIFRRIFLVQDTRITITVILIIRVVSWTVVFSFLLGNHSKFLGNFRGRNRRQKLKNLIQIIIFKNTNSPTSFSNMSQPDFLKNQLFITFNEEAIDAVRNEYTVICRRNKEAWPTTHEDDDETHACCGCSVILPEQHRGRFCGPQCASLGMTHKIRSLSIHMGLSYLFPMSSLVKQSRMTSVGLWIIMMFLYDHHFGVNDMRTIWYKIEAEFVYRNPLLLKL